MTDSAIDQMVDRCPIYNEPREVLADFKRTQPSWPHIVGYLLVGGAEPERITLEVVSLVAEAYFTVDLLKGKGRSIAELIDQFGLKPAPNDEIRSLILEQGAVLDRKVFENLGTDKSLLYEVPSRRFEEIIAALLEDMGCEVRLTPETRDGGRDILAVFQTPFGEWLTLVECKRYRPHRLVGIGLVERFLWIVERNDKASCGLIATTSFFSSEAQRVAHTYRYRLKLIDFDALCDWIGHYGRWDRSSSSGLWTPSRE